MEIVITGSSGLIGTALVSALKQAGHRPIRLVRRDTTQGTDEIRWDPGSGEIDAQSLEGIDAVINLAGAGIGAKRWNKSYKELLISSRIRSTALLSEKLAAAKNPPKTLLSGSAIGYYGERGDEILTEESEPGDNFLAELSKKWENAAQPAIDAGIRTAFLRTSIVLTPKGGALKKMLPLFKIGLGGKFGSGSQYMSWISLTDEVRAIMHLLESNVSGPVNLASPLPVTNAEFTKALGAALKRPTIIPVPAFGPKLLLGSEMAQSLLFDSVRVVPNALRESGFEHKHDDLKKDFRKILEVDTV